MTPPMSEPAMPTSIVMNSDIGSLPGSARRANAPINRPQNAREMRYASQPMPLKIVRGSGGGRALRRQGVAAALVRLLRRARRELGVGVDQRAVAQVAIDHPRALATLVDRPHDHGLAAARGAGGDRRAA